MKSISAFLTILLVATALTGFAQESVFYSAGNKQNWLLFPNHQKALYKLITDEAFDLLDQREKEIEKLATKEDWQNYQENKRLQFNESLKKFRKTPLNAKVTGKLERENFTVEKIIFESHPGFYVTSALFLPKNLKKPAPAVIYCAGHSDLGFRSDVYQRIMMNLVEKGFVVFAFDPIGQGERLQYVDEKTGKSAVGGPTIEHSYTGIQTLLTGTSLADYFIWDGVRAIDYLETRPEVDAKRLGITGRSGGGTQSALIAAFDERIYAAAPECYITGFKRLLQSIGPQDAEQNPYHLIKNGFDHADFIHLRAPKPMLVVTTTHDFFSQQGARETFAEAQKSYSAFGTPANLQFAEDFGVHESTKNNRETVYAFFRQHLNLPGNKDDMEVVLFSPEELWATSTGQVGTSLKGKTVFDLNLDYFAENEVLKPALPAFAKKAAGIEFNRKLTAAVYTGKLVKDHFEVEKYFLENTENDYALPVYVVKNKNSDPGKIIFWLSENGKSELLAHPETENFAEAGFTIISVDLPGIGELHDPDFRGDGFVQKVPFNYTFGANLAGKSIPGVQAEAIDLAVQFIHQKYPAAKNISASVSGKISSAFLHFTALKNPFSKIVLTDFEDNSLALLKTRFYNPAQAYTVVPGSVGFYDLNDLIGLLPEKTVLATKRAEPYNTEKLSEILDFLSGK